MVVSLSQRGDLLLSIVASNGSAHPGQMAGIAYDEAPGEAGPADRGGPSVSGTTV
jgi:hypothetical protein